ncbi:MAG: hypothetical protein ABSB67_19730 [Bryobacteraceae bacterium]|jgi:hypothetical protein
MTRRTVLSLVCAAGIVRAESLKEASLRGTLTRTPQGQPSVTTAEGKTVLLDGDEGTRSVVNDERLRGMDFEALGHFITADRFMIDPIYQRAMFVHKDGKRLFITYWCNVCYIRTYVPGNCRCCQKYTDLDLTENDAQ